MAVIPHSQVELARSRQAISRALKSGDWRGVQQEDLLLLSKLEVAIQDPHKDIDELLRELKSIVGLYRDVVHSCHIAAEKLFAGVGH